ncbi:maleylpyruvate isomerase family mycothiol-dependent enzyme [Actinotalea solisilvae]|uniref:maleylpyruvate isomerase family mycothiol-dependent enzyme n=1 Tax=Actinotalea solisilvae TaxID=2072922 RepID=UPI0018F25EC8|nr:maleylpyruvate isomerase family mycothiol-dependent enzyme [Actinotalea solisilvae]
MTTTTDLALLLDDIRRVDDRLRDVLDGLTDDAVRGPSRLPGWTRGHVLAHLAGLGAGVARQLEHAVHHQERVDFYDGGRAGRDGAIEAGAGESAAHHADAVRATVDRVEHALDRVGPELLDERTGYRDRPVSAVVRLWWREVEIHLTDLDLGPDVTQWSAGFRAHLHEYLVDRVPAGVRLDLAPTDVDERRALGEGDVVTVRGAANDLAAWLAGREPAGALSAERGGVVVALPELEPWP